MLAQFLLIFTISFSAHLGVSDSKSLSIYEVLQSNGLPIGLLPKGVTDFQYDDSGRFEVHLEQPCNAKFENMLHYERNVSGTVTYGQIAGLSGISAMDLFLWFPVKGIRVDVPPSGLIYFDVGVVFKQFSLSVFETPPECEAVKPSDLRDERFIARTMSKSLSSKLPYELDQGDFLRAVL